MPTTFTVAFICHGDFPLLERLVPHNLDSLCQGTTETYDTILIVDGAESGDTTDIIKAAPGWRIDEVRLRWRARNAASGDCSNNGHVHLFSDKTPYLITLEGDVAVFRRDQGFDVLRALRGLFEANPGLCVATRADDNACWVSKLARAGRPLTEGLPSVNRVSSHFLVYDTRRAREWFGRRGGLRLDAFRDVEDEWYNYEDMVSATFAAPRGPGIGYLEGLPIAVYHCDRKVEPGSPYYTKNLEIKLQVFEARKREFEDGLVG